MQRLWAPWRKAYIRPKKKQKGCLFCRVLSQRQDRRNLIVKRTPHSFAILNLYPYNNGHLMIVPRRHVKRLGVLADEAKLDLLALYDEMLEALQKSVRPHGFNVGLNLGRVAGAGIPGHLHLHIVPRWRGDVNLMPVLGETKVISESLASVYKGLQKALK